jgi:hypothetical protein
LPRTAVCCYYAILTRITVAVIPAARAVGIEAISIDRRLAVVKRATSLSIRHRMIGFDIRGSVGVAS